MKESQVDFLCCLLSDVIVSGLAGKETANLILRLISWSWQLSAADFWLLLVGLVDGLLLSPNIPQEYKPARKDVRCIGMWQNTLQPEAPIITEA